MNRERSRIPVRPFIILILIPFSLHCIACFILLANVVAYKLLNATRLVLLVVTHMTQNLISRLLGGWMRIASKISKVCGGTRTLLLSLPVRSNGVRTKDNRAMFRRWLPIKRYWIFFCPKGIWEVAIQNVNRD